ncbi:SLAM family member 9-like isoform X2 [Parambassis ranga]|uniref:SLAM family member 9-like isoform X2 n=1 Tax=Parambassis ranga TaxID=210632 RepID=A0A6P7JU20_9TELE|nr:SLAM family member 9-like isoform X2 [Parambassis ranga]
MTQQFSSSLALSLLVFVTCSEAALTVKVGDQVVLKPGPVTGDITDIMWKHNEDIVLEWDGAEVTYYKQHLKGRCELNNRTAELKILSLTLEDSGSYTAEVNRMVQSPTEVLVLASVPKPTVSETCDPQEDYCTLSCDGNTTGTGPVTYTWMSGDTEVSSTKDYILTKDAKEPSFHCVLNNTVSSQSSEEFHNRFIVRKLSDVMASCPRANIVCTGNRFLQMENKNQNMGTRDLCRNQSTVKNGTANNPDTARIPSSEGAPGVGKPTAEEEEGLQLNVS